MNIEIKERPRHKKIEYKERHILSPNHWYRFLPRRLQYWIAHIGVKLGIIRRYGVIKVVVNHIDGTQTTVNGYNILPDVSIKHLGDILANVNTTETDLAFMEPGSGTTTPVIGNTDTETPLTPADRKAVTSVTRSITTPFEVVASLFLGTGDYTRPQTINELCVFFEPDETGDLFARGVLATAITLSAGETSTLTYGFVFR